MRFLLTVLLISLCTLGALAQGTIKGILVDTLHNETLIGAHVSVMKSGQKAPIKAAPTDAEGKFSINGLSYGRYKVQFSYVGYRTESQVIVVSKEKPTYNFGKVTMEPSNNTLGEATVTGQRTAIKLEVDRKSYNVAQDLSNVGASASEALENIPSVEVDQDGTISLRGSSSVEVWINGKASGLTSDNRASILEQLPAESIDHIEVIDNPGSKYSAEGSAGIINIVLKRDRRSGYYGSVQAGANTAGGANVSGNINYNSKWVDVYANIGYRHHRDKSGSISRQTMFDEQGNPTSYQNGDNISNTLGHNIFTRAGVTLHASEKDDITLAGNLMKGWRDFTSNSPYRYGIFGTGGDSIETEELWRDSRSKHNTLMYNIDLEYRHTFREGHFIEFKGNHGAWMSDNSNIYLDRTDFTDPTLPTTYLWQSRPQTVNNRWASVKLDYENRFNDHITLQAGYNGDFKHENTPQESYATDGDSGEESETTIDKAYYNRFIYINQIHALYANATMKFGRFGVQAGLRGEYWNVDTESRTYDQDKGGLPGTFFKKDYFQLFPSLFLSYQLTESDQLQLNYTRRLQRPWGGELNSFVDTREANSVRFGNPQLEPEYSNSVSLNYLKTFSEHSFLVSAFYRPTTNVKQHISYRIDGDPRIFSTSMNMSQSTSAGGEITLKNKFWKILDLTTTGSAYYYHLNAFNHTVLDPLYGQEVEVSGKAQSRFTWNIRIKASVSLPYDWSIQATGEYRSKQALAQGWRDPSYGIDLGVKKMFLNRQLTVALNCRDLLDSRKFISTTETENFNQYSKRWRHARKFNLTITWNFGNTKSKKPRREQEDTEDDFNGGYE